MSSGTLCMRTMVTSGRCLDATVLTGKVTGVAAPCMESWMVPADANCCLCCAKASLKDRLVEGGFELLSGLSSSDVRSDAEACGTHSPRGDQSNPPQ